tara:strand:+ start:1133 stop:1285 length:153 start_codon:yes stop_codon:yes gene_type:complete
MNYNTLAFDDFIDDCLVGKDPICQVNKDASQELIASKLISELINDDEYFY